jgi:hypothetical protein
MKKPHKCLKFSCPTLNVCISNSMEYCPSWHAYSSLGNQESTCNSHNLKVWYCVHWIPSLVPILIQINPSHFLLPGFFKIHYNVLPSMPRSSLRFPHYNFLCTSLLHIHGTYCAHLILMDLIPNNTCWWAHEASHFPHSFVNSCF